MVSQHPQLDTAPSDSVSSSSAQDSYEFDLFVIGAGSGGVRAARMAAATGARVGVAEERYFGGTCVNVGCVPKKLFVYASHYSEDFEDSRGFGWNLPHKPDFDWATLRDNKDREIARLNGIYVNMLQKAGVTIFEGRAVVAGPYLVRVNDREHRVRHILIATGSWPFVPHFPGSEWIKTSNDFFHLESLPSTAVVVGGGYIAVELAGILNGLGVQTTLVYRGDLILRGFDRQIREFVTEELQKKGVQLLLNADVREVRRIAENDFVVQLSPGDELQAGLVLYATGRKPLVHGMGLEELGVQLNVLGEIEVDQFYQSNVPGIYALGDITPGPKLTPVALAEAMCLVRHLFQGSQDTLDYSNIPTAVFCQPNIGTVGLTEEEAREQYTAIRVYETSFRPMKGTMSGSAERTYMKLLVVDESDLVIGAHMVGPDAGELIQGIAVAIRAGATKRMFDTTIGIHPTAAEEFVTLREVTRR